MSYLFIFWFTLFRLLFLVNDLLTQNIFSELIFCFDKIYIYIYIIIQYFNICEWFHGTKVVYIVVQPSPCPTSRIFYLLKRNLCNHWTITHHFIPTLALDNHHSIFFVSINLTILGISYKWNLTVFIILWLHDFT